MAEEVAANWVERKDKKTGRSFWGNKVTKGTTWTRPACLGPSTASAPAAEPAAAEAKPGETAALGPDDVAENWVERKVRVIRRK